MNDNLILLSHAKTLTLAIYENRLLDTAALTHRHGIGEWMTVRL